MGRLDQKPIFPMAGLPNQPPCLEDHNPGILQSAIIHTRAMNTIHLKGKSEMKIKPYQRATDYERIGNFLIETFQPGDQLANWLQPRWEYMHYHVFIDEIDLSSF